METLTVDGKGYPLTNEVKKAMDINQITKDAVRTRMSHGGWTLYQAVNTPVGMKLEDFIEEQQQKRKMQHEEYLRQRNLLTLKEQKLREKKPHLFNGTPQTHSTSEFGRYLSKNNLIARVKTDSFGRVQLL